MTTLNLTGRDESVAALFKKIMRVTNIIFMKMTYLEWEYNIPINLLKDTTL